MSLTEDMSSLNCRISINRPEDHVWRGLLTRSELPYILIFLPVLPMAL
jgi:hypothetical protein